MEEERNYNNNNGRVAIITGSSRGIGKAIAREFADTGYSVVINALKKSQIKLLTIFQSTIRMVERWSAYQAIYPGSLFVCL